MPVTTRAMKTRIHETKECPLSNPNPLHWTKKPKKTYSRWSRQKVESSSKSASEDEYIPSSLSLPAKASKKKLSSMAAASTVLWPRINYREVSNNSILTVLPFHPDAVVKACSFPFFTTDGEAPVKVIKFFDIPSSICVECLILTSGLNLLE